MYELENINPNNYIGNNIIFIPKILKLLNKKKKNLYQNFTDLSKMFYH